jgi:glycosyltransferase involved in cell wall biosynthesis
MPKVVIVMPAYRAVQTLEKTVAAIPAGVADELLLVDDASPDGTADLARQLGLRVHVHVTNRGYGGNQKTCYTHALSDGADIVVLLHPDYQYEPEAVPLLIAPILAGRADMTFGSRFAGLGDPMAGGMPVYRYLGNRLTTTLENLMLGARFTETHSGMRAYTRECILSLPFLAYSDDFAFDSQLLVDAVSSGQRVVEVPIPTRYTEESSSIGVGRSIRYVAASLAYCARRTAERGRRGRRNPTARSIAVAKLSWLIRLLASVEERFGDRRNLLDTSSDGAAKGIPHEARGFLVRGIRVMSFTPDGSVDPRSADVLLVRGTDLVGERAGSYLQQLRTAADDEGLLVVNLQPPHVWQADAILRALPDAGFRPVGFDRSSGGAIVVARPVSRRT